MGNGSFLILLFIQADWRSCHNSESHCRISRNFDTRFSQECRHDGMCRYYHLSYDSHPDSQAIEFDRLSEKEIDDLPELPLVVARCSPETKGESDEAEM